jgi:UDP-glucose 4-epimerase
VGESIDKPQEYFDNNIGSLENVLTLSKEFNVKKIAFASSAVVYGNTDIVPTNELVEFAPISPYAETKCIGEDMICKWCQTSGVSAVIFRFSNPIGANMEFMFGDHSKKGVENLLPYIVRSAIEGKAMVFRGNNHATPDGTPIRDYISVVDLADIVKTVLLADQRENVEILNVGRGVGFSLLEIVKTVENELHKKIQYSFAEKSNLEASVSILDSSKLYERYKVEMKHGLKEIVQSQIKFFEYINAKK